MKKSYLYFFIFSVVLFVSTQLAIAQNTTTESHKWKKGILTDEFIYESSDFPSVHAATITETSSGLVAAFFGGKYEGHPEVSIYVSRHTDEGWTAPVIVAEGIVNDTLRKACYNPVLFQYPDGELLLFYKIGKNVQDWTGHLIRSYDGGQTWTKPEALPEGFLGPIKNKPELIGNKLICASSTENDGWQVHIEFTEDRGKTWRKTAPINSKPWNIIQPSILKWNDGTLQIVCRSQNEHIISAFSKDNGETWSDPVALYLPNNNSGTDAVTLRDGRHLIVYNHVAANESAYKDKARTPLNVALSDDGITWKASLILEDSPIKEYSYPSVIQGKDGMVHIVYTWRREKIKYVKVDPSLLIKEQIKDGQWPD
jgi:alpha-L-rhamnosidase